MKTNEKIEELNYIKLAYQTNKFDEERLQESIESLAKEKSIAFFDFLKSLLYDPRLFWKSISIDNMIYFKNEIDKHTIDKIQKLFGLENDVDLKISAAHLLGFSDKDSEEFLYSVYKKESNVYVKSAIAASIFVINNIPPFLGLPFSDRISSGEINPSEVEIKNFMQGALKQKDQ